MKKIFYILVLFALGSLANASDPVPPTGDPRVNIPIMAFLSIETCTTTDHSKFCSSPSSLAVSSITLMPVYEHGPSPHASTEISETEKNEPSYHYRGHGTMIYQGNFGEDRLIGLITVNRYGNANELPKDPMPDHHSNPAPMESNPPESLTRPKSTEGSYVYDIQVEIIGTNGTEAMMTLSSNSLDFANATLITPLKNNGSTSSRALLHIGPGFQDCTIPSPGPLPPEPMPTLLLSDLNRPTEDCSLPGQPSEPGHPDPMGKNILDWKIFKGSIR